MIHLYRNKILLLQKSIKFLTKSNIKLDKALLYIIACHMSQNYRLESIRWRRKVNMPLTFVWCSLSHANFFVFLSPYRQQGIGHLSSQHIVLYSTRCCFRCAVQLNYWSWLQSHISYCEIIYAQYLSKIITKRVRPLKRQTRIID